MARRRPIVLVALVFLVGACAAAPAGTARTQAPVSPATGTPSAATAEPSVTPSDSLPLPSGSAVASGTASWRQIEPSGPKPAPREDGTWTLIPGSGTAYLFGGRDGSTVFDDLWAFDLSGESWTELTPSTDPPPKRFGHEAVWVDGIGVVIYAGQAGPTTFFDDLWAFDVDANRWRELPTVGARPTARYGTCAALGPDGRLWISHGFTEDGTRFADTQAFDFSAGRWTDETPDGRAPVNRCLHGCWWTDDGRFALYAGQTTGVAALGDLWTLADAGTSTATWSQATAALPADRNLYAFARHRGSVVITGGRALDGTFLGDAFRLQASTLAVESLDPRGQPPGRAGAMMIDDPDGGRVLLFGGKDADGALADLWELTLP